MRRAEVKFWRGNMGVIHFDKKYVILPLQLFDTRYYVQIK